MPLPLAALGLAGASGYGLYKLASGQIEEQAAQTRQRKAQASNIEQEAATRKAALSSQQVADYLIRRKSQPGVEDLDAPQNPAAQEFLSSLGGPNSLGAIQLPEGVKADPAGGQTPPIMIGGRPYEVPPGFVARPGDIVIYGEDVVKGRTRDPSDPEPSWRVGRIKRVLPQEVANSLIEIGRNLPPERAGEREILYTNPAAGGGIRAYGPVTVPQGGEAHVPVGLPEPGQLPPTRTIKGPEKPARETRQVFAVVEPNSGTVYRYSGITGELVGPPIGGGPGGRGGKEDRENQRLFLAELDQVRQHVFDAFGIRVDPNAAYEPTDPWVADALTLAFGAYNKLVPVDRERAVQGAIVIGQLARSARDKGGYANLGQYLRERARSDPKARKLLEWYEASQGDVGPVLEEARRPAPEEEVKEAPSQSWGEWIRSVFKRPEPEGFEEEEE